MRTPNIITWFRGSSEQRRRREEEITCSAHGGHKADQEPRTSLRSSDTAEICGNVVLGVADGELQSSIVVSATKNVSGRLRLRQGLRNLVLAATSAFDATSRRQVSSWPLEAERCSGVNSYLKITESSRTPPNVGASMV